MSGAVAGGAIAAIIAAKKKKDEQNEEEELTNYNSDDMDKWEFKIMRSALGKFGKYENVKKLCVEEAKAGWELLEVFDQHRIRFRRPIEKRSMDAHLDINPYRTSGGSGGVSKILLIGLVLLTIGGVLFTIFMASGRM